MDAALASVWARVRNVIYLNVEYIYSHKEHEKINIYPSAYYNLQVMQTSSN